MCILLVASFLSGNSTTKSKYKKQLLKLNMKECISRMLLHRLPILRIIDLRLGFCLQGIFRTNRFFLEHIRDPHEAFVPSHQLHIHKKILLRPQQEFQMLISIQLMVQAQHLGISKCSHFPFFAIILVLLSLSKHTNPSVTIVVSGLVP